MMGYDTLIRALHDKFGMSFVEYNTGGGEMCLRAVTESGHWVHITDAFGSLSPAIGHTPCYHGFGVTVFADDEGAEFVYANADDEADIPDVITLVRDALDALAGVPASERQEYQRGLWIRYGTDHWGEPERRRDE